MMPKGFSLSECSVNFSSVFTEDSPYINIRIPQFQITISTVHTTNKSDQKQSIEENITRLNKIHGRKLPLARSETSDDQENSIHMYKNNLNLLTEKLTHKEIHNYKALGKETQLFSKYSRNFF